jgi:hypothetical protein
MRNYKVELEKSYEKKNSLFADKGEIYRKIDELRGVRLDAFKRKNEAYVTLNYYQDCIDSWYSKSERTTWLFGNAGKKLPKHSIFGQSFGDLDSDKYHRDEAYSHVQACKEEIEEVNGKIGALIERIGETKRNISSLINDIKKIKEDRNCMFELKKEGNSKAQLQNELRNLQFILNQDQRKLREHESKRSEFVVAKKHQYGVIELENKIKFMQTGKDEFIKEFHLEENHIQRIAAHRTLWLKEKNMRV